jgi:hypothetical protein
MTENEWRNKIDDYHTSIQAIVGFANFYVWDPATRSDRDGVVVFQGRRLTKKKQPKEEPKEETELPSEEPAEAASPEHSSERSGQANIEASIQPAGLEVTEKAVSSRTSADYVEFVTPDLGVVTVEGDGVLAEVKISFPKSEEHWFDDFDQLMSYDAEFEGWPTEAGTVPQHDVVLITEQGRASKVKKFFEKHQGDKIQFTRPFVIVQCNRSDNREPYYFFHRIFGKLSSSAIDGQLEDGTKVPMKVLVEKYSTVKIYDAEPPLPYMMDLIWSHVVLEAARVDPKFPKLRKRQKLPVVLDVDEIVQKLREGFTFRAIAANASDGSPAMPHSQWVKKALEQMVSSKDAEWIDATKTAVRILFQMYEDALDHFIKACLPRDGKPAAPQDTQRSLPFTD